MSFRHEPNSLNEWNGLDRPLPSVAANGNSGLGPGEKKSRSAADLVRLTKA